MRAGCGGGRVSSAHSEEDVLKIFFRFRCGERSQTLRSCCFIPVAVAALATFVENLTTMVSLASLLNLLVNEDTVVLRARNHQTLYSKYTPLLQAGPCFDGSLPTGNWSCASSLLVVKDDCLVFYCIL